jgi:hypothetical protein
VLARLFRFLASSLVPGGGYFVAGWSPATALTLYWVDNVVGSVAMAVRILLHRRATGAAGHSRAQLDVVVTTSSAGQESQVEFRSFLTEFLVTSTVFSVAHGIFLAAVTAFVLERPDPDAVREGAIAIAICHAIALTVDRFTLASWPFARLKEQAQRMMGRVALVNIALLGGTWVMAFSSSASFFSVFVWLKAASDIGSMLPSMETRNPPRVLVWMMSFFPKQNGETFEEYWRRTRKTEEEKAALDEQVERGTKKRKR